MKAKLLVGAVIAALVGSSLPAPAPASDTASIYDTLRRREELTVLFVAVTEAKEAMTLRTQGPYTLFAPSDTAFKALDDATIRKLASDKETVRRLLRSHLVEGKFTMKQLAEPDGKEKQTVRGAALRIEKQKDEFRVNGAKVVTPDILCSNGVIHVIDAVLPFAKE